MSANGKTNGRQRGRPDYELTVHITGYHVGDTSQTHWVVVPEQDMDSATAAQILARAAEALMKHASTPNNPG